VVRELQNLKAPLLGVFGNNDGDHELLKKRVKEKEGWEIRGTFATILLDQVHAAVLHGHEPDLLEALLVGNAFDLVVYGHSHQKEMVQRGRALVVNPGETCGYLTGIPTIAVFDTETRKAEMVEL
jgi:hypothetical protein